MRWNARSTMSMALLISLAASAAQAEVWELEPCRIELWITTDASPYWTQTRVQQLQAGLNNQAASLAGAGWQLQQSPPPEAVVRRAQAGLAWLDRAADVQTLVERVGYPDKATKAEPRDKVIVLHLTVAGRGFVVESREWDAYTALWGPAIARRTESSAALLPVAFSALEASCGGVARAIPNDDGTVRLRVRGGNVPTRDPALAPVQRGDVLRVVKRSPTAGVPKSTPLEWTYLTVDSVEGAAAQCRVFSQYQKPLAQPLAGREQWVGIVVASPQNSTRLRLVSSDPAQPAPLSGYELVSYAPGQSPAIIGRTDHRGEIEIPPAAGALRVLLVKSGQQLLLRLPMIPGWQREVQVPLTSDDARLAAEGIASTFTQQLVEAATRREILLALARARISAGQNAQAQQFVQQAQAFDATRAQLEQQIQQAKSSVNVDDPIAQQKINKMFEELLASVNQHLGSGPIQQLNLQLSAAAAPATTPENPPATTTPDAGTPAPTPNPGAKVAGATDPDGRVRYAVPGGDFSVSFPADVPAEESLVDEGESRGGVKRKLNYIYGSTRGIGYTAAYVPAKTTSFDARAAETWALSMGADYQTRLQDSKTSQRDNFTIQDCTFSGNVVLRAVFDGEHARLMMIRGPFTPEEQQAFFNSEKAVSP